MLFISPLLSFADCVFQEIVHFIFIGVKLFMVLPHYPLNISKLCGDITSPILDIDNLSLFIPGQCG